MELKEILKTNFSNAGEDIVNIGIEALLEDDSVLEKVPVLNIILGAKKTITSVQDAFLVKKMIKFLTEADSVPLEGRVNFIAEKLNGKEQEFTEKLLHTISRLDDADKSEYIAKLYRAVVYEKITLEEFYRFLMVVDKIYIKDLEEFASNSREKHEGIYAENLSSLGIVTIDVPWEENGSISMGQIRGLFYSQKYKETEIGSKFKESINSNL